MKKMLILLSAVIMLAGGCCNKCQAEDLINYVPADIDGVISVDADRLVNLSQLKDLRKENGDFDDNWTKFESELGKYGLKTKDLPSRIMVFFKAEPGTQNAGILAVTKIPEAKLVELLKANKDKVSYVVKTISGRKAYVITRKDKKADTVVISYLKTNLVLICDENKAEQFCKTVGKTKNAKLIAASKKADPKALVNILFAKEAKTAVPPVVTAGKDAAKSAMGMPAGNPADTVKSAVITMNLVGKEQKDISLKADLDCADANGASQMAMQLKTLVMIMGMQMAQDPALSKSVTEAIKIDQKDSNIKIDVSISETLLNKIKAAAEEKKKQALAAKKAAVAAPAAAPAETKTAPVKTAPAQVKK